VLCFSWLAYILDADVRIGLSRQWGIICINVVTLSLSEMCCLYRAGRVSLTQVQAVGRLVIVVSKITLFGVVECSMERYQGCDMMSLVRSV